MVVFQQSAVAGLPAGEIGRHDVDSGTGDIEMTDITEQLRRALEKFELAEVKQDAERYRCLRNKVAVLYDGHATLCVQCHSSQLTDEDKCDTDTAIDAVMKGK